MADDRDLLIDDLRDDLAEARAQRETWRVIAKVAIEQLATLTTQNARLRQCLTTRHEAVCDDRQAAA